MKEEKDLIIIRGLPGSGKTTIAEIMKGDSGMVCTADDFLMENGKYYWTPERAHVAHKLNQRKALMAMEMGVTPVVIANTNTVPKEWKVYQEYAEEFDYRVHTVIIENRHGGKNSHNVPEETMDKMKNRFNIML